MASFSSALAVGPLAASRGAEVCDPAADFKRVYDEHLHFMWRASLHLGVAPGAIEDVLRDVFLVVHRRLPEFEGRSTMKTWLFGILLHVVRNHRRSLRRKSPHLAAQEPPPPVEELASPEAQGPHRAMESREAWSLLHAILDELDDVRREVFVLAELEQMTVPEIAGLLGENANTIYGRLRSARQKFEMAVRRHRAREAGQDPRRRT